MPCAHRHVAQCAACFMRSRRHAVARNERHGIHHVVAHTIETLGPPERLRPATPLFRLKSRRARTSVRTPSGLSALACGTQYASFSAEETCDCGGDWGRVGAVAT
jgi:hypothetical protein